MRAYGAKRSYGRCRTFKRAGRRKIRVVVAVKNKKAGRLSAPAFFVF